MKAVAKTARGPGNVELIDARVPQAVDGHVVVEVRAAGICGTDLHIYHDEYPSNPPVILGHEVAGVVAEVGDGVTSCSPGDRVTSETYFYVCGSCEFCRDGYPNLCAERLSIGSGVNGAFAKYIVVPALNVHRLPQKVDDLAGALTEPLACCVHALEHTRVEPGNVVVVSGPGTIGLLMSQVANAAGAQVVVLGTAVDSRRLELARELAAAVTINVEENDTVQTVLELTAGIGADVVFECSGVGAAAQTALKLVRRHGRYAQVGLFGRPITWDLQQVALKEIRVTGSFATVPSAWRKAVRLMESGQVQTRPLVSHVLPMTQWEEAFRIFESRQGVKIVLTPAE